MSASSPRDACCKRVARRGAALRGAAALRSVALIPLGSASTSDRHFQQCVGLLDKLLNCHLQHCVGLLKPKHAWRPWMSYGNVMYLQVKTSAFTRQLLTACCPWDAFGALVGFGGSESQTSTSEYDGAVQKNAQRRRHRNRVQRAQRTKTHALCF